MKKEIMKYATDDITTLIVTVRGKRVILDRDLAALYGVPTFRFNEAVKRNRNRFPEGFMFQLTRDEVSSLTSQIAMSKPRRGGRRTEGRSSNLLCFVAMFTGRRASCLPQAGATCPP